MIAITSREALAHVNASGRAPYQRELVAKAIAQHPGLTASEIDAILRIGPVSVRRRLSDLKNAGVALRGSPRKAKGMAVRECTWYAMERQGELL